MRRITVVSAVAAAAAFLAMPAGAAPPAAQLRCTLGGGFGLIVTSQSPITCVYYRVDGIVEFYTGSTRRVGVDIGPDNASRVTYKVVAPNPPTPAALEGVFVGPEFGASIGQGLSANALVGVSGVTLLPTGNEQFTGLNVTVGLSRLQLDFAGSERRELHSRY